MSRALGVLATAGWWAAALASLAWWLPSILLRLAQLAAGPTRFGLVMATSDGLKAAGQRKAAERVYLAEAERCRARAEAIRARREW